MRTKTVTKVSPEFNYLETLPLNKIVKYAGARPKDGVSFIGYAQQHRTDQTKMNLVNDPLGKNPALLEFKLADILFVEELPQAVTEMGEGVPLIKLWIRKGARGVILEPFEVNDSADIISIRKEHKERFIKSRKTAKD